MTEKQASINERYIINGYIEITEFEINCPKYHLPAMVDGDVAWVIDSSNMYMTEMLNWRDHWKCGDFEHGLDHTEYVALPESKKRELARYIAVDCNQDFDMQDLQVFYTADTIEEIIDIITEIWDNDAEYFLSED